MNHHNDRIPGTRELMQAVRDENERLAARLEGALAERDAARQSLGRALLAQSDAEEARDQALDQLAAADEERLRLAARCLELEQQNTQLVYLQVASNQLHGTFDRDAALLAMRDIVINLVGCEEMGIWGIDEKNGALPLLESFGLDRERWGKVPLDGGLIGLVALTGKRFVAGLASGPLGDTGFKFQLSGAERNLTACIPLKLGNRVVGAIALFSLLPQKGALEPFDLELFDLLASHGAEALLRSTGSTTVPGTEAAS